jgi:hypothetical protein
LAVVELFPVRRRLQRKRRPRHRERSALAGLAPHLLVALAARRLDGRVELPPGVPEVRPPAGPGLRQRVELERRLLAELERRLLAEPGQHPRGVVRRRLLGQLALLQPPPVPGEIHAGETQIRSLLALPPEVRPTALVVVHDRVAARALRLLLRAGVSVPDEISVVGIGDVEEASATMPPLTTVAVPRHEMGVLGVRRLADLLAGTAPAPYRMVLYTRLVERESTGPPRAT